MTIYTWLTDPDWAVHVYDVVVLGGYILLADTVREAHVYDMVVLGMTLGSPHA